MTWTTRLIRNGCRSSSYQIWSPESVNVVENACYHNVQINRHSTSNVRIGEMLFWLDKHGIRYSSDMTKAELYDLIKMHKPQYETCNWLCARRARTHGNQTTSLPPWFKPYRKKICGIVKTRIATKMLFLRCEIFSNWQSWILPQWQWKSGLLFADMLQLWKKNTWVGSTSETASRRGS
jgi:hypothetical protein